MKQGGGQDRHQPGGWRRATPRSPSRAHERCQPSGPPSTSRHMLCTGPGDPQWEEGSDHQRHAPVMPRPPWGQNLQHQDSRVGLYPNPKAASAVSPSHPHPSHLGHLPSGCPGHPWGAPAHTCRALWPSRRPGRPCPESPSFLSQSGRDPWRPHPRREKSRGRGGAARTRRDTGAEAPAPGRHLRMLSELPLPAGRENSQHILQAASPTLLVTKTAAAPPPPPATAGHPAFRKPGIHESRGSSGVRVHQP